MPPIFKSIFKDGIIYGLGGIAAKSIGFLTIPIYTRFFSPAEFGVIDLLVTLGSIFGILFTPGIDSAHSFYFMEAVHKRSRYTTTDTNNVVVLLRLIIGCIVFSLLLLSLPFLSFLNVPQLSAKYLFLVALAIFFGSFVKQNISIFRLLKKPKIFSVITFLSSFLTALFIIVLVYIVKLGLDGYFFGGVLSAIVLVVVSFLVASPYYSIPQKSSLSLIKKYLSFGLPLVPAGLMVWVLQSSDRWFILKFLDESSLGLYSVAAKFSFVIMLAVESFRLAWWPYAMDCLYDKEGPFVMKKMAFWYVLVGSVIAVCLAYLSPYLMAFLADSRFYEGWVVIGVLCWSAVFYGFFMISGIGIFSSKKTYYNILAYGVGAVLNLVLNFFLVSRLGLLGAAIATSISILVANIVAMIISNKFYRVDWEWSKYVLILVCSWGLIILRLL